MTFCLSREGTVHSLRSFVIRQGRIVWGMERGKRGGDLGEIRRSNEFIACTTWKSSPRLRG